MQVVWTANLSDIIIRDDSYGIQKKHHGRLWMIGYDYDDISGKKVLLLSKQFCTAFCGLDSTLIGRALQL